MTLAMTLRRVLASALDAGDPPVQAGAMDRHVAAERLTIVISIAVAAVSLTGHLSLTTAVVMIIPMTVARTIIRQHRKAAAARKPAQEEPDAWQ